MRILALDTSSRQGSVALIENPGGASGGSGPAALPVLAAATHEKRNAHGEEMLRLIDEVLLKAQWERHQIDLVAIGRGPGSFTGLRIGLALGQGIAAGLGIGCVGVGSLEAMASAADHPGPRCAVVDAHRNEVFAAITDEQGHVKVPPTSVPRPDFQAWAEAAQAEFTQPLVFVGEDEILSGRHWCATPEAKLPHAIWVGRLGAFRDTPAEPIYVRGADVTHPGKKARPGSAA